MRSAPLAGQYPAKKEKDMLRATTVNAIGLKAIQSFLAANHKMGAEFTEGMLRAWAVDAEFQLGQGNPATIEIKSWDSVSGATVEFTVPDDGLDFSEVWQAWIDGAREEAVEFLVPLAGTTDVAERGANALGVEVSEELNVDRI